MNKDVARTHTCRQHTGRLLSHEQNEIMPSAATWMGLEIILSEASQRKANIIRYHLHVENKYNTNEVIYETERVSGKQKRLTDIEIRLVVAKAEGV